MGIHVYEEKSGKMFNGYSDLGTSPMVTQKLMAFTGPARVGKDTFTNEMILLLEEMFPNVSAERFAFADGLRAEVDDFCIHHFGISAYTEVPEEKLIIRPFLIAFGNAKRNQSNNQYWIKNLAKRLSNRRDVNLAILSDLRFCETETDEMAFLKASHGLSFHIRRYDMKNGRRVFVKPPNEFEKANEPRLKKAANQVIEIATIEDEKERKEQIREICSDLIHQNFSFFSKV